MLGESGGMNATIAFVIAMGTADLYDTSIIFSDGKTAVSLQVQPFNQLTKYDVNYHFWLGCISTGICNGLFSWWRKRLSVNLNLIYNMADFVNKILFGLIIWRLSC